MFVIKSSFLLKLCHQYVCVTTEAGRKENRLYVAGSVACLDELFGELKLSPWGGGVLYQKHPDKWLQHLLPSLRYSTS